MKTAKQLRDKFNSDLLKLQNACKHKKISDWMDYYWAPGHTTGQWVKVCEICEKVVETKNVVDVKITTTQDTTNFKYI